MEILKTPELSDTIFNFKVGLKTMFSSAADFSGMTLSGRRKPFVSSVIQKAFIEVTEEGTEAAAATG